MGKIRISNSSESYVKVGRIRMNIAKVAKIKCADIYISKNQIIHIGKTHKK